MKLVLFCSALTLAAAFGTGCSSNPKKVDIPVSSNPTDELRTFENDLHQAEADQVSVSSPTNYEKAKENYNDAKEMSEKGKDKKDIFEKLGYARAYLNIAISNAAKAKEQMPSVLKARQDAITSGAPTTFSPEFKKADKNLKSAMEDFEKDSSEVKPEQKDKLTKAYNDLELKSIKAAYLGEAQKNLETAQKNNAEKLSPKTYADTKTKILSAERVIETDRHDVNAITQASTDALNDSKKLLAINNIVKNAKSTPEDVALRMNSDEKALSSATTEVDAKNRELRAQDASLNAVVGANQQLAGKVASDQQIAASYENARKQFTEDEADVYRQGSNVLIRLKTLDFKSGRADLSKNSLGILSKVEGVIKDMGAQKVVVEGHTDSVGAKAQNEKLSKQRADIVAKYFVTEGAVDKENIQSEGYGFEKPIASNKTKEGRAQNRRVDVVITPSKTE